MLSIEGGGEIRIGDGEIVAATTGSVDGYPAMIELLSRRSGSFTLTRRAIVAAPPLAPMMSLILDSARLDDEWRRIANHVVVVDDSSLLSEDDACMVSLLQWIDGHRTVAELLNLGVGTTAALLDSLKRGLACGGISRRASTHKLRSISEPEQELSFDELIDLARGRIRAGALEDAERLFHRALNRRPSDRIARQNLRRVAALMSSRRLGSREQLSGRQKD